MYNKQKILHGYSNVKQQGFFLCIIQHGYVLIDVKQQGSVFVLTLNVSNGE